MKQMAALGLMSQRLGQLAGQPHFIMWMRNLLVVLLLLSACLSLSKLFWLLIPSPDLPEAGSGTPKNILSSEVSSTISSGSLVNIDAMVAANLFGKASAIVTKPETPAVVASLENAVETRLNLVLKGVMLSSDPSRSFANIASGRDEKIYAVGDRLPGGSNVQLQQVMADRIILSNSGRSESLFLFENVDFGKPNSAPINPSSSRPAPSPARPAPRTSQVQPPTTPSTLEANETRKVKRVPKSLSEVIKFSIAREQGEIVGYKIRPGRDKQAFTDLGLQTNDIVTDINGIALNSSSSITKVYREMRQATSASVTLLREGQSYSLNLQLDSAP